MSESSIDIKGIVLPAGSVHLQAINLTQIPLLGVSFHSCRLRRLLDTLWPRISICRGRGVRCWRSSFYYSQFLLKEQKRTTEFKNVIPLQLACNLRTIAFRDSLVQRSRFLERLLCCTTVSGVRIVIKCGSAKIHTCKVRNCRRT